MEEDPAIYADSQDQTTREATKDDEKPLAPLKVVEFDVAIDGPELDRVIEEARDGSAEALYKVLFSLWTMRLLDRVSDWAWRRYKVALDKEGESVQDVIFKAIRRSIGTFLNPNNVSWRACLRAICYRIARNHSLNVIDRERKLEKNYQDSFTYEHTPFSRDHRPVIEPCSPAMTAEEEKELEKALEREDAIWAGRASAILERLQQIIKTLTPDEQAILRLWAQGNTIPQTAAALDKPTSTMGRKQKKLEMLLVEEVEGLIEELGESSGKKVRVEKIMADLQAHRAAELRKVFASALGGMAAHAQNAHGGVCT
jgi:DNA-directed RNA polymerase specialized sigma24 family protein